ncbi:MAG: TIGR04282 family arsenosugar biosynthesis glycosyltransferase [Pseudomonadota bacterium]
MKRRPSSNDPELIVFVRAPEQGKVKTRLARHLGETLVLAVYRGLVEQILAAVYQSGIRTVICYCPDDKGAMVSDWLGTDPEYRPQSGDDLGDRMFQALDHAFSSGCSRALLMGSDIPDVTAAHLLEALSILDQCDIVLGPALDGGYWLVGLNRNGLDRSLFHNVDWGTDRVLSATTKTAAALGLTVGFAATLRDVDTLEDLMLSPAGSGLLERLKDRVRGT